MQDTLNKQNIYYQDKLKNSNEQNKELTNKISETNNKMNEMNKINFELLNQINGLENKVKELDNYLSTFGDQNFQLETQILKYKDSLKQCNDLLEQNKQDYEKLNTSKLNLEKKLAQEKINNDVYKKEMMNLQIKLDNSENKYKVDIQKIIDENDYKIKDLQKNLDDCEEQRKILLNDYDNMFKSLQEQKKQTQNYSGMYGRLNNDLIEERNARQKELVDFVQIEKNLNTRYNKLKKENDLTIEKLNSELKKLLAERKELQKNFQYYEDQLKNKSNENQNLLLVTRQYDEKLINAEKNSDYQKKELEKSLQRSNELDTNIKNLQIEIKNLQSENLKLNSNLDDTCEMIYENNILDTNNVCTNVINNKQKQLDNQKKIFDGIIGQVDKKEKSIGLYIIPKTLQGSVQKLKDDRILGIIYLLFRITDLKKYLFYSAKSYKINTTINKLTNIFANMEYDSLSDTDVANINKWDKYTEDGTFINYIYTSLFTNFNDYSLPLLLSYENFPSIANLYFDNYKDFLTYVQQKMISPDYVIVSLKNAYSGSIDINMNIKIENITESYFTLIGFKRKNNLIGLKNIDPKIESIKNIWTIYKPTSYYYNEITYENQIPEVTNNNEFVTTLVYKL